MKRSLLLLVFLIHYSAGAQNFQWVKAIGGSKPDYAFAIASDAQGNTYTAGKFLDIVDFDPGPGSAVFSSNSNSWDCFVMKLDASGNFVWAKTFGGKTNNDVVNCITFDYAGNVYVAGAVSDIVDLDPGPGTYTEACTGQDAFVLKLDASGSFIWARTFKSQNSSMIQSVSPDPFGNITCTGYSIGQCDFDPGPGVYNVTPLGGKDLFILKLNIAGNFTWARRIGAVNSAIEATGTSIVTDANGDTYTTGYFNGSIDFDPGFGISLLTASFTDVFLLKLDAAGNFAWARSFGGTHAEVGSSIFLSASGHLYAGGRFMGTADLDPGPGVLSVTSAGVEDAFLSKFDLSGNLMWARTFGGPGTDKVVAITCNTQDDVCAAGYFQGTVDFDPGPGTSTLSSPAYRNAFILKLDPSGNYLQAKSIIGTNQNGQCEPAGISTDALDNIYTAGRFWTGVAGTIDFDPDADTVLISAQADDVFIHKLGKCDPVLRTATSFTFCNGENKSITATGAYSYTWQPGGATTPTLASPQSTMNYTVTGIKSSDCVGTAVVSVMIDACTGLEENSVSSNILSIYPNPSNGQFVVKSREPARLQLINELGQNIRTIELSETNQYRFTVNDLPGGLYFVVSGKESKKILVQR